MGKPFGEASRRTFGRIGTLVPFPCWNSLGVMSSDTLKFSKQPPSEALKGGLPVSVLQLSGKPWAYLTGQAIATYIEVRLIPQVFGRLASGHFCSA